jgi:hypothetical protein
VCVWCVCGGGGTEDEAMSSPQVVTVTAQALSNYEAFHALPRGTATEDEVAKSSAGIQGWAAQNAGVAGVAGVDVEAVPAYTQAAQVQRTHSI